MNSIKNAIVSFCKSEGRTIIASSLRFIADTIERNDKKTSKK